MELYPLLQDQHKDLKMEIQVLHYSITQMVLQSRMVIHYMLLIIIITESEKYQPMTYIFHLKRYCMIITIVMWICDNLITNLSMYIAN